VAHGELGRVGIVVRNRPRTNTVGYHGSDRRCQDDRERLVLLAYQVLCRLYGNCLRSDAGPETEPRGRHGCEVSRSRRGSERRPTHVGGLRDVTAAADGEGCRPPLNHPYSATGTGTLSSAAALANSVRA